ncbi:putative MFS family arabinose efflux permease [Streptomyces sp. SLBN-118]|uniref:MFS transporter n=1 Tax=Streptomyces sp. SLBN-118 TaxID=2768454 RepID=UPI00114F3BF0|nr:MFS transporter [Streptomyces sp. SLBN-118]TQK50134.1 putative MFS family arabinose efflux permease [Streptomyces sp. SLBN-118]
MEQASVSGDPDGAGLRKPPTAPSAECKLHSATRDVRLLWSANAADALGTHMSTVAFPLLLLGLGYTPATVGLLAGAGLLVALVCGPVVAVAADRGLRKPVMVTSAALAATAMAAVAASVVSGQPPLGLLLGAFLAERIATACFEAAARGTIALVSAPQDLPRVVAGLEAGDRAALVAGPALGGMLYQISRTIPFAADAASYVVTALCVRFMRSDLRATSPTTPPPATAEAMSTETPDPCSGSALRALPAFAREAFAGFALLRSAPRLRLVMAWTTTVNAALSALYFTAVFTLQAGGGGAAMGVVLALSGAAGLVGSVMAPALVRRLGGARTLVGVTWLMVLPSGGLAFAEGPWAYGLCFGTFCLILAPATVVIQAAAIADTPSHLQARTGAVLATAAIGAAAVSPVLAGALVTHDGPAPSAVVCAAALALLALFTSVRAGRLKTGG